jgi:hypothetical protein
LPGLVTNPVCHAKWTKWQTGFDDGNPAQVFICVAPAGEFATLPFARSVKPSSQADNLIGPPFAQREKSRCGKHFQLPKLGCQQEKAEESHFSLIFYSLPKEAPPLAPGLLATKVASISKSLFL